MPKWLRYSNNNPLNQFAEITLATHAKSHEMLLAKYLQRLQGGLEQKPNPRSNKHIPTPPPLSQHYPLHHTPPHQLTPSNSPSPPPAHISPTVSIQEKRAKQPPLPPLHTRLGKEDLLKLFFCFLKTSFGYIFCRSNICTTSYNIISSALELTWSLFINARQHFSLSL